MSERIIATGFEKAFIKSWSGWDQVDTVCFQFYNPEFTFEFSESVSSEFGISTVDCIVMDLENGVIEGLDNDGTPLFNKKFKLVLENEDV